MTLSSCRASLHPGGEGHLARREHPIWEGVEIFLVTSKRLGTDFAFTFIPVYLFAYFAYFYDTRTAVQMHVGV